MYLTLVCEPHLINIEEGTKLLKVKRSTRTSVSSDTMATEANFDQAAWTVCKRIWVSAFS